MWIERQTNVTRLFFLGSANLSLTVGFQISKLGSSFGNSNTGATVLTEIGDGWYLFNLDTTDTNTLGPLYYKLTGVTLDNDAQLCDDVVLFENGRFSVFAAGLGNNAIGAASIVDGAITAAKLAVDAIGPTTISDAAKLAIFTGPTLPEAYPALGAAPTPARALLALLQLASNISISGTTLTVFGLDGTTPIMTFTLNSATTPTSRTRAT